MQSIYYRTMEILRWIFGVVPRSAIGSPVVFRVVHYTFWALVIIVAGLCSTWVRPESSLADYDWWFVRRFWLGIVIFLMYLLGKATVYVLGLLKTEDRPEFEDIERCWFAGMEALERERLDFQWIPVFVVNGLTAQQERSMFRAADIPWRVVAPPLEDTAAVLRFYANDEQIFLSCTGVGAINRQLNKPVDAGGAQTTSIAGSRSMSGAGTGTLRSPGGGAPPAAGPLGTQVAPSAVPAPRAGGGTMVAPPSATPPPPAPAAGGILGTLRNVGTFIAQNTMLPGAMARVSASAAKSTTVSAITPEEIAFGLKRMEYLADLLLRDRHPYCPINGMIQASPLDWSEDERSTAELSPVAVHDMRCLHSRLGLQFPIAFLLTGLDKLDGLPGFVRSCGELEPRFKASRAGSRFPAGAPVNEENAHWVINRSLSWFRGWVYAVFAKDLKNPENKKLYHLLCELQQRRDRLVSQLRLSFSGVSRNPNPRLVGYYFAATGDASSYQGFIKGLLLRLVSAQGDVAWHPEHIRGDEKSRKFAYLLFALAAVIVAVSILYGVAKSGAGA
ncbi:MAG: type VI secretion protein IcmF/TssM N-terminal domain-containing protein [Planctomycetaceae bacterium]